MVSEHILDELSWRGLIAQSTDLASLRAAINNGPLTLYAGFDPTAPSLHAGNLVPLLMLRRFQRAGHRPIVLAGGATGMIGDPRDVGERTLNSAETVSDWAGRIQGQLARFVEFGESPTSAIIVNNLDWTGNLSVLEFLRDVGKHFSINVMLSRDTVKKRLNSDGMSYTEFSYLLLQSHDYLRLYRKYGATLQIGGSDQWGNIIGGVDLIRKVEGNSAHALTTPLITDAEGRKFGKSTGGGSLWLDPTMTSPYAWYQYFINVGDADVIRYLKLLTLLPFDAIDELSQKTIETPHLRLAQKALAKELTTLVHGERETSQVIHASQALYGTGDLRGLDLATLESAMAQAPVGELSLTDQPTIVDLLVTSGLAGSKGAARRVVNEGGAYLNNIKVTDETFVPAHTDVLHGSWLIVRKGKRNTAGIRVVQP